MIIHVKKPLKYGAREKGYKGSAEERDIFLLGQLKELSTSFCKCFYTWFLKYFDQKLDSILPL